MNNNEKLAKVAINKSLLKEYSNSSNERIVYMNDGTEFQIQIFNPYSYVIGISFEFNNNINFSKQLLVLRPGERVWLDRYLDNESRLLFSTYEVGTSNAIKEAIKNNGNLCIKFFKECEKISSNLLINDIGNPPHIDVYYNHLGNSYCDTNIRSLNYCESNINNASLDFDLNADINTALYCGTTANAASATNTSFTSTTTASTDKNSFKSKSLKTRSKSIETGRIEEGSHSNQKFNYVHKDFEYWPFKTEYIKILPTSQKQINANDLTKKYCHKCGRKLNQKYKFCPYCGAKQ